MASLADWYHEVPARVEDGRLWRYKMVVYPDGGSEVVVSRISEPMAEWIGAGMPTGVPTGRSAEEKARRAEENRRRAVNRAKQAVRQGVRALGADHMLTLTYREVMGDYERLAADWKRFVRLIRERWPNWVFLAVPELQARGSWHLHVACVGWQDVVYIRRCWYRAIGGSGEERGADTPGNIDVRASATREGRGKGRNRWDSLVLAGYLSKYMGKTFDDVLASRKRFWSSRVSGVVRQSGWLEVSGYLDAVRAAHGMVWFGGSDRIRMHAVEDRLVWVTGWPPPVKGGGKEAS